jgi:hypothetical protein
LVALHKIDDLLRSNISWACFQDEFNSVTSIDNNNRGFFCQDLDVVSKTLIVLSIGLNNLVFTGMSVKIKEDLSLMTLTSLAASLNA